MKQIDRKPLRRVCGGLLAVSFLGASVAAGCGRVKADDTGSETHWLVSCGSDLDCDEGSCECGVCTRPCYDAPPECSELGIAGVQCTQAPPACGANAGRGGTAPAAEGAVCLLPCASDADCTVLGAQAFCAAERCEVPAAGFSFDDTNDQAGGTAGASGGTAAGGQGDTTDSSSQIATLCDGSEDVRLAYVSAGGFAGPDYEFLSGVYGYRSFVIDGQCRFWQTRRANGWVYTGTLDAGPAQEFAEAIGYGQLSSYGAFDDPPCPDGTISTLSAPEGSIRCSCQCTTNPEAPAGWLAAFRATSPDALEVLFAAGEPVSYPARLVLSTPGGMSPRLTPQPWPLDRAPTAGEVVSRDATPFLTSESGALVEDAAELAALRSFRAFAVAQDSTWIAGFVPVVWSDPQGQGGQTFDLFMRDEVPEKVRGALVDAAQ